MQNQTEARLNYLNLSSSLQKDNYQYLDLLYPSILIAIFEKP